MLTSSELELDHSLHGLARALSDRRINLNRRLHRLKGFENLWQSDLLHVRAQVAGPDEFNIGAFDGDVVAHRTLCDENRPRGSLILDVGDHS